MLLALLQLLGLSFCRDVVLCNSSRNELVLTVLGAVVNAPLNRYLSLQSSWQFLHISVHVNGRIYVVDVRVVV